MSKTLKLDEVLKQISNLQWRIGTFQSFDKSIPIHASDFPNIVAVDNDDMLEGMGEINAAYLCHAANQFPELVRAVSHLLHCDCQSNYIKVPCEECEEAKEALQSATQITIE